MTRDEAIAALIELNDQNALCLHYACSDAEWVRLNEAMAALKESVAS